MKKATVTTAAAVSLGLLLAACSGSAEDSGSSTEGESYTLRLGHGGAPGDVLNQSVDLLAEILDERTDGRIVIENYGASQLGNERDLIEGISMGTVDMTLVSSPPLGNFVPEALIYDLPGLFVDLEHAEKVAESPVVREYLAEALDQENLHLLTVTHGGFRGITNSRAPIESIDDFAGLKMRVQESPMILATYDALPGVNPVPIPIGDLYTALDQGIADAQENPPILVRDFKIGEVQKYMTLTDHSYFPRHLIINSSTWESMSDSDKALFEEAAAEMQTFKNQYYRDETENAIADLEEGGMEFVLEADDLREDIAELMQEEVHPQFYDEIGGGDADRGRELIEQVLELAS